MWKKIKAPLISLSLLGAIVGGSAWALPNTIRFQGRLTDSQGRPIVGSPQIRFEIYDAATDGRKVWYSPPLNVNSNEAGLFSVDIDMGPSGSAVFGSESKLFLQITVKDTGSDQALSPRQQLSNVPFAFYSQVAASATVAASVPDNSISKQKIQNDAIDSSKIGDRSVMTVDMATDSVSSPIIADGGVKGIDLEDETITPDKMNTAAFTTAGWVVPQGAIFMFLGANCPAGYDEVVEFRNRVAMGADIGSADPDVPNAAGQEFGSKTHTHIIGHSHGTGVQQGFTGQQDIGTGQNVVYFSNPKLISGVGAFGGGDNIWLRGLDHSHQTNSQDTTTSGATLTLPPALTTIFCRKQ